MPSDAEIAERVGSQKLKEQHGENYRYAVRLARFLQQRHFPDVDDWRPLSTLSGVLSQIDNMIAGIPATESRCPTPEARARAEAEFKRRHSATNGAAISATATVAASKPDDYARGFFAGIGATKPKDEDSGGAYNAAVILAIHSELLSPYEAERMASKPTSWYSLLIKQLLQRIANLRMLLQVAKGASEPDSVAPQTCVECYHERNVDENGRCKRMVDGTYIAGIGLPCNCKCVFPARAESAFDTALATWLANSSTTDEGAFEAGWKAALSSQGDKRSG